MPGSKYAEQSHILTLSKSVEENIMPDFNQDLWINNAPTQAVIMQKNWRDKLYSITTRNWIIGALILYAGISLMAALVFAFFGKQTPEIASYTLTTCIGALVGILIPSHDIKPQDIGAQTQTNILNEK